MTPLRKSKSFTTEKTNLLSVDITLKRRSTGCLRRPSFYSTKSTDTNNSNPKVNNKKSFFFFFS
jgi:hypothetical protein